jgi:hypothetical protein
LFEIALAQVRQPGVAVHNKPMRFDKGEEGLQGVLKLSKANKKRKNNEDRQMVIKCAKQGNQEEEEKQQISHTERPEMPISSCCSGTGENGNETANTKRACVADDKFS